MKSILNSEAWNKMVERVDRQVAEEGGSTGSNMAEPLWFPPGPAVMPENLSPEEVARIEKELEGAKEALARMGK